MKAEKLQIPKSIQNLLGKRDALRKEKNFAEADIIRNKIREKGYEIRDTESGSKLRRV